MKSEPSPSRNEAVDHIRVVLTMLVIVHHVSIGYGGAGGWYWRGRPEASSPLLVVFNAVNQSFFMGFFFLLAGYFTPGALERKGTMLFLRDRLIRLGVPWLLYFLILSPITVGLGRGVRGGGFGEAIATSFLDGAFGPGPLWFVQALLVFSVAFAVWRHWRPGPVAGRDEGGTPHGAGFPGHRALLAAALGAAGVSFLVRLVIPVGAEVASMQLGYFPCYILLFAAGCAASRGRWLEAVTLRQAGPWMGVSAVAIPVLPAVLALAGDEGFRGGWNPKALLYAVWDPLVAWGVILGLCWAAVRHASRGTALSRWMARNAFAAYVVHPPVAVGFSVLASPLQIDPHLLFAGVGAASCGASFAAGALLRRIPGLGRIL